MKKVGILTYHSSDNYGSVLQAYALRKYLSTFCDAEIVDYRRPEVKDLYKIIKPMNSKFNVITNFYNFLYYGKLKKKKAKYEKFRQNFLNLSEREIAQKCVLDNYVQKYDALVCGSDQVWNFDIIDFDTSYLLDFPEYNGLKLAYAASMGPRAKSFEQVNSYKSLFENMNLITVRESTASDVLSSVLDKPVDTVIDPVFLLSKDEWEETIKDGNVTDYNKGDYVFCYFPGGVSSSLESFSVNLAKKLSCERVLVVSEWRNLLRPGKKMYDCGPLEFVNMIKNAKAVCTDSFHGTAFSIIMDTPIYVEIGNNATDSRINTLLSVTKNTDSAINHNFNHTLHKSEEDLTHLLNFSKRIIKDKIE